MVAFNRNPWPHSPESAAALAKPWDDTIVEKKGGWENLRIQDPLAIGKLASTPFKSDRAKPNGSSIAIIADYQDRRVLLAGDAHSQRISNSLAMYRKAHQKNSKIALVKASHHGSRGNTPTELVQTLACSKWVFSTNGDQFGHPDQEAVARVILHSPETTTLFFNYRAPSTEFWNRAVTPMRDFKTVYGDDGYICIDIP
jgi:hypothetical protein